MREKNLHNITLSMILISSALWGTDLKELFGKNMSYAFLFLMSFVLWTPFYKVNLPEKKVPRKEP